MDLNIRSWDVATRSQIVATSLNADRFLSLESLAMSADGKRIAAAWTHKPFGETTEVKILDVAE